MTSPTDNPLYKLGFLRMAEAIEKSENLFSVFENMLQISNPDMRQDIINGGTSCLAATWVGLRDWGMKGVCADSSFQPFIDGSFDRIAYDLLQSSSAGKNEIWKKLVSLLCSAVSACKMYYKFNLDKTKTLPDENVLAVRLVSSPDRVTVQTVQRDSNLEIVSTTTRETDSRSA